jgi:UTP--glucose-1-phosphate uridylyltransferase
MEKLQNNLNLFQAKMQQENLDPLVIKNFSESYLKWLHGDQGKIPWSDIQLPPTFPEYQNLTTQHQKIGTENLDKLVYLKLNGGLGTSIGCKGPKSALKVFDNFSFLDLIAKQIKSLKTNIHVIFMNSFNTDQETHKILKDKLKYTSFLQNKYPKINLQTNTPLETSPQHLEWAPPGHGDVFFALFQTGIIDQLSQQGYEYIFLSNVDNLGATVDPKILGYMISQNLDFIMETTPKTLADIKGGTLITRKSTQKLELLESIQVEDEHLADFQNIQTFKIFNTNNIWVKISALKEIYHKQKLSLSLMVNPKTVNQTPIIQLETAMGSAIKCFSNTSSIIVPRTRFFPVKNTTDLLLIRSDFLQKNQNGTFQINPQRKKGNSIPKITLSDNFKNIRDFEKHFPHIPSLINCESLTLEGDIYIDENVTFEGNVTIKTKEKNYWLQNQTFKN